MESEEPLLSICIPTYNRDYILKELLIKLCPLAEKYNVEICISDNASPDNTENIVREYCEKYSNIIYVRQSENLGSDQNAEFVLKMSHTKYRWLFGDYNYIEEDCLCSLLSELEKDEWDLFVIGDEGRTRRIEATIYTNPHLLLEELGWHVTWLSCLIYNENMIKSANYERYYKSRFLQTGIIFEYFINHLCHVKVDPNIFVSILPIPKRGGWQDIAFEVFCRDWYLFVMSLPVFYSFEEKEKCIKMHGDKSGLFTVRGLFYLRYKNIMTFSICQRYSFFIKRTISTHISIIFLISVIPVIFVKVLYILFAHKKESYK